MKVYIKDVAAIPGRDQKGGEYLVISDVAGAEISIPIRAVVTMWLNSLRIDEKKSMEELYLEWNSTSPVTKKYAERYAKVRDLRAHGLREESILIALHPSNQGETLDNYLDSIE